MMITLLLSIMMMAGLFLLLWAGVGFIQNKRLFSTAPIEVIEVVGDKKERFKGQHLLGYTLAVIAVILMIASILLGAVNGVQKGFTFAQLLARFLLIFLLTKAFDIIFFDWFLLCNRCFGFFEKYYPEVADVLNSKLFGYNKKDHLIHILFMIIGSLLLAWICRFF